MKRNVTPRPKSVNKSASSRKTELARERQYAAMVEFGRATDAELDSIRGDLAAIINAIEALDDRTAEMQTRLQDRTWSARQSLARGLAKFSKVSAANLAALQAVAVPDREEVDVRRLGNEPDAVTIARIASEGACQ